MEEHFIRCLTQIMLNNNNVLHWIWLRCLDDTSFKCFANKKSKYPNRFFQSSSNLILFIKQILFTWNYYSILYNIIILHKQKKITTTDPSTLLCVSNIKTTTTNILTFITYSTLFAQAHPPVAPNKTKHIHSKSGSAFSVSPLFDPQLLFGIKCLRVWFMNWSWIV